MLFVSTFLNLSKLSLIQTKTARLTVAGNILTLAIVLSPSTPHIIRTMFPVPYRAIEGWIACRIFRTLKLRSIDPHDNTAFGIDAMLPSSQAFYRDPVNLWRDQYQAGTRAGVVIETALEQSDNRDRVHGHA
jgi:hypothetical protein